MSTWPTSDTDADLLATDVSADSASPARARNSVLLPFVSRFNNLKALVNSIIGYGDPKVIPPGRLIGKTVYSGGPLNGSSAFTFTPQAATAFLIVEVQGAGGPGCDVTCYASMPYVSNVAGPGGMSGAYCKALITSGFSSVAVQVAGNVGTGGAAPITSFGALVKCQGGYSSSAGGAGALPYPLAGGSVSAGITLGSGVIALNQVPRRQGEVGIVYSSSLGMSGAGADSPMGAGAPAVIANAAGSYSGKTASGFGAGGSGGLILGWPTSSSTSTSATSGVATGGCVIVYEYS